MVTVITQIPIFTAILLSATTALAQTATSPPNKKVCSEVTRLDSPSLSETPSDVRGKILQALKPDIVAIVNDSGLGMDSTTFRLQKLRLDAVSVGQVRSSKRLYAVHWGDNGDGATIFGVNGMAWIVEVDSSGARNLVSPAHSTNPGRAFGAWGMQVLPGEGNDGYPEIMLASKGFREGGGAEAQAECLRMDGGFYKPTVCPPGCFENLNSR